MVAMNKIGYFLVLFAAMLMLVTYLTKNGNPIDYQKRYNRTLAELTHGGVSLDVNAKQALYYARRGNFIPVGFHEAYLAGRAINDLEKLEQMLERAEMVPSEKAEEMLNMAEEFARERGLPTAFVEEFRMEFRRRQAKYELYELMAQFRKPHQYFLLKFYRNQALNICEDFGFDQGPVIDAFCRGTIESFEYRISEMKKGFVRLEMKEDTMRLAEIIGEPKLEVENAWRQGMVVAYLCMRGSPEDEPDIVKTELARALSERFPWVAIVGFEKMHEERLAKYRLMIKEAGDSSLLTKVSLNIHGWN